MLVPLYRSYFSLKKWASSIFAPAKNKIIYPLLNKSTIHVIIIGLAVAVIANNLMFKETAAEELGQKTILASMTTNPEDATIVERARAETVKTTSYYQSAGLLTSQLADQQTVAASEETNDIMKSESSAALVSPGLSSTTEGSRPREAVTYYNVEGGDTVSTIAEKFGVSVNTLLWENKLGPRDYIKPGDKLTILPVSGVSYQVKKSDTLNSIAKRYSVEASAIMDYNKLADASAIEQNQILIVPGGTPPEEPKPQIQSSTRSGIAILDILEAPPPSRDKSSARLLWPTPSHKINQYYTGRRHTGLDIDGTYSSPLYAADDGRVEFAGSDRSGYGLHIVVNHGGGVKTLYGHASKIFVKVGDSVKRGQTIGMMGCTGRCTGTHVHFEVRINGGAVNPLGYIR